MRISTVPTTGPEGPRGPAGADGSGSAESTLLNNAILARTNLLKGKTPFENISSTRLINNERSFLPTTTGQGFFKNITNLMFDKEEVLFENTSGVLYFSNEIPENVDLLVTGKVGTCPISIGIRNFIDQQFTLTSSWETYYSVFINSIETPVLIDGNIIIIDPSVTNATITIKGIRSDNTELYYTISNFTGTTINLEAAITNIKTYTGTLLVEEEDYVFLDDRQRVYFLNNVTGDVSITGRTFYNGIEFGIEIEDTLETAQPYIYTNTEFETVNTATIGDDVPEFVYDTNTQVTLFLTNATATSVKLYMVTEEDGLILITLPEIVDSNYIDLPDWWDTITSVTVNGEEVDYTLTPAETNADKPIITIQDVALGSSVLVTGTTSTTDSTITYTINGFTGTEIALPIEQAYIRNILFVNYDNIEDLLLTQSFMQKESKLYFGDKFPSNFKPGILTLEAINGTRTIKYTSLDYYGNLVETPISLSEQTGITVTDVENSVFSFTKQKAYFTKKLTGTLYYDIDFYAYQGLAKGGETLKIVSEIEGLMATTNGTGEHLETLTFPTFDYPESKNLIFYEDKWWLGDYDDIVIYYGDVKPHDGFTDISISPVTPKLPYSPIWEDLKRTDTAMSNIAFTPDPSFAFNSSTFEGLVDSVRSAENSLRPDSLVQLSVNPTVRGMSGVIIDGPLPVYYGGTTTVNLAISTYKWFIAEVVNTNDNDSIEIGDKVLFVVQNGSFSSTAIACILENNTPSVATDVFKINDIIGVI